MTGKNLRSSADRRWHTAKWLFLALAVAVAIAFAKPDVPAKLTLFAGPQGSSFYQDGERYRDILAEYGVTVELVATAGSVDNLQRLIANCGACAGFAEAVKYPDTLQGAGANALVSLGSLYVEPFWVFARRDLKVGDIADFKGLAVAPGHKGSGVRVFANTLLQANGIEGDVTLVETEAATPEELRTAIGNGKVDALFASGATESPLIDALLRWPDFRPVSLRRTDSFAFRYPGIKILRLPEGSHDLALNIPDHDLELLGVAVQLVVPASLPGALSDLLLQAAREVHGGSSAFAKRGDFPSPDLVSLPLGRAAAHFYERGPSPLWRMLPFRLATLVDRFLWVAASVASTALALFGIIPKLVTLPFKRASSGLYRRLERVEKSLGTPEADKAALLGEVTDIDRASRALRVPRKLLPDYMGLRQDIHDVRERVAAL